MKEKIAAIRQEITQTMNQEVPLSVMVLFVLALLVAAVLGVGGAYLLGGFLWPL